MQATQSKTANKTLHFAFHHVFVKPLHMFTWFLLSKHNNKKKKKIHNISLKIKQKKEFTLYKQNTNDITQAVEVLYNILQLQAGSCTKIEFCVKWLA